MSSKEPGPSRAFIGQQRLRLRVFRGTLLRGEERTLARGRKCRQEHGGEAEAEEGQAPAQSQYEIDQATHDVDALCIANIGRALQIGY